MHSGLPSVVVSPAVRSHAQEMRHALAYLLYLHLHSASRRAFAELREGIVVNEKMRSDSESVSCAHIEIGQFLAIVLIQLYRRDWPNGNTSAQVSGPVASALPSGSLPASDNRSSAPATDERSSESAHDAVGRTSSVLDDGHLAPSRSNGASGSPWSRPTTRLIRMSSSGNVDDWLA